MSHGEAYAQKIRAYQTAFRDVEGEIRSFMRQALADFQEECDARPDQTTFHAEDANGRVQAFREGKRQAYLYLERILGFTPEEINAEADRLDEQDRERELLRAANRRPFNAA